MAFRLIALKQTGVIGNYAIGGAIAAAFYYRGSRAMVRQYGLEERTRKVLTGTEMKPIEANKEYLEYVVRVKASWRRDAQAMTWEEKIAAIERMRKAAKIAKAAGVGRRIDTR